MGTRTILALILVLGVMAPPVGAGARTARIELAMAVEDQAEDGLRAALEEAVQQATRGAAAMGMPYVGLQAAERVGAAVVVQLVASDSPLGSLGNGPGLDAEPDPVVTRVSADARCAGNPGRAASGAMLTDPVNSPRQRVQSARPIDASVGVW